MFEYLDTTTIQNAFPASHHAIQYIRQWAAGFLGNSITNTTSDLTPAQAELAKRIVQEIEAVEGKPVAKLSYDKVENYVRILGERIEQLSRQELNANQSVGKNLLDKLRAGDFDSA
jgi:hypothetical protein